MEPGPEGQEDLQEAAGIDQGERAAMEPGPEGQEDWSGLMPGPVIS